MSGPMSDGLIRVDDVPQCPICGAVDRRVLYSGMKDRLFGVPGEWTLKECLRCETAFLDPRPTPDDLGKAYATYYTHSAPTQPKGSSPVHRFYRAIKDGYLGWRWGYNDGLRAWQKTLAPLLYLHPGRRTQLDSMVMYLSAMPGARLLDVGCGSGELIERLGNLGWQTEGIDIDALAVQTAQERGLRVRLGTLEDQSYPDASFDAVTMNHVIEHVHDPCALLRECHRILKPDGRLVVVTPNIRSLGHGRFKEAYLSLDPPRHLYIFTPDALRRLGETAGFQKISVSTTIQGADWVYAASESIKRIGTFAMDNPMPWTERLRGRLLQHLDWAVLMANPAVGEEIVTVLEK
jgi:2-polyprenyl-3-methyl-5-hydroxy-6-metoxy-1,4-benzoquinol methylase